MLFFAVIITQVLATHNMFVLGNKKIEYRCHDARPTGALETGENPVRSRRCERDGFRLFGLIRRHWS
jgi:hypothetical protein